MNRKPAGGTSIIAEQDEPPAGIRWDGGNRPDPDRLRGKLVLPPVQTLIGAEEDVIGGFFVVRHDENGTRVSEFVEMGILVNFLPGEPSVATHESIAVRVTGELFSDISDGHDQTWNGRGTKRGSRIETLRVSVKVKSAFLKRVFSRKQADYRCRFIPSYRTHNCDLESQPWEERSASRSHLPERNVNMSLKAVIISPTIVMTDTCLQFLLPAQVAWIGHDVDNRNSVQPNHLLKIDVPTIISVDIVHGQTEVGSIGIRFEDIPPVGIGGFGKGDVQEDGAGARVQDCVSL